jgi:hypothetical protein
MERLTSQEEQNAKNYAGRIRNMQEFPVKPAKEPMNSPFDVETLGEATPRPSTKLRHLTELLQTFRRVNQLILRAIATKRQLF